MIKEYCYWNKELEIEKYTMLRSFIHVKNEDKHLYINKSGEDIIFAFDGTRLYDDAIDSLVNKYNDTRENVEDVVEDFLSGLDQYGIELSHSQKEHPIKIKITGEESFYPKVASIELTEKCNIKCLHCYGEFCSSQLTEMPIDKLKQLLRDLSTAGVKVIELTGGDISMYPHIYEAVEYALGLSFDKIDLLTNGVSFSKKLANLVIANKERFLVQIDIHSLKDEYLHWFTQTRISNSSIQKNIEYLVSNGVKMRIATVFTSNNLDEFFEIAEYVHSLNQKWGITPVEPLGRADFSKAAKGLYLTQEESMKLYTYVSIIKEKYPNLLGEMKEEERANEYNCGVLTEHIVINAKGNIKLCTMDNLSYGMESIGNVISTNIKEIYNQQRDFITALTLQETPQFDSPECQGCPNQAECIGCMLRTFINVRKTNFECKWFKTHVNPIIKERWLTDKQ